MNGESAGPALLARRFIESAGNSDHIKAVQAQVHVTLEVFEGLLFCCIKQNGIASECLLRSLFDSAINAIILAKHPESLQDFIRHGKFMHMRMMRFITDVTPAMKRHVETIIANTESEWEQLFPEFKNSDWHKLGTKDAFAEAEFSTQMYDKYFRPASAYAHAEPYIVISPAKDDWSEWQLGARPSNWKHHALSDYNLACWAMLQMLSIISRELKLGYEEEIKQYATEAENFKQKHIDAIKEAFEEHYKDTQPK